MQLPINGMPRRFVRRIAGPRSARAFRAPAMTTFGHLEIRLGFAVRGNRRA